MSSNGSVKRQPPQNSKSQERNKPKDQHNSSLLKYFADHPPVEEEVDIDFALNDHCLEEGDGAHVPPNNCPVRSVVTKQITNCGY